MAFSGSSLEQALEALGELLESRGHKYRLAAVGGGALLLLGLIERSTDDLDIVAQLDESGALRADPLPPPLREAVADVARALDLPPDWLNPGPGSLLDLGLPVGFAERAHVRSFGALEIRLADRVDQINFKLYASVDQGPESKHFADLRALEPAREELLSAAGWARTHDPSEGFRAELEATLEAFGARGTDGQR